MAIQRRSLVLGSLVGLAIGTAAGGCGTAAAVDPEPAAVVDPGMPPTPRTQPPAVSGGTLLVLKDGKTAVAADPDRDVIWVADLEKLTQTQRIDLQSGEEPGRQVEDGAGRVHVALRRGGALLTIDPATGKILARRAACAAPRGLAYDPATDRLYLACAGGELVTFAASGGAALRTVQLDSDLRDVVVSGTSLLVSRFRSAELLTVYANGTVGNRFKPQTVRSLLNDPSMGGPMAAAAEPAVAWQLHALPDGRVAMLFERGVTAAVDTTRPGGYGNGQCKGVGIVGSAITVFGLSGETQPGPTLPFIAYSVDFAVTADGSKVSLVAPAGTLSHGVIAATLSRAQLGPSDPCLVDPDLVALPPAEADNDAVAVAYDGRQRLVVLTRSPGLIVGSSVINFQGAAAVKNAGHTLFHTATPAVIACASCHPEGGDDGRVWNFIPTGARRTQDLRGGLLATAPFHWDGDMTDMQKLMTTVFVGRMGGAAPDSTQVAAIASWLDAQPIVPKAAPTDLMAVARGKQLFESATVGCATCHSGAHFTNNATAAVGTGKAFQVPSLINVAMRAPYMHSGCAATLADRFDPACGGGENHGHTAQLAPAQLADLMSYLQTL